MYKFCYKYHVFNVYVVQHPFKGGFNITENKIINKKLMA